MHEPQQPTVDEHGDDTHPAFALISAGRISATAGEVLFGSDLRHQRYIRVTLTRAARARSLNRDWIHPAGDELVEINMSEAQWAAFVSSIGTQGVPCTLRTTETMRDVPGLPFAPRLAESIRETNDAVSEAFGKIQAAMAAVDALDAKAPAKERRAAMAGLRSAITAAPGNVAFAAQSLREHTEDVVTRARADLEAMVNRHAQQLGLDPAAGRVDLPLSASPTGERL